jgi:hypothetical protein
MHERFCLNTAAIKTASLDRQIELTRTAGARQISLLAQGVEATMAGGRPLCLIKADMGASGLRVGELCFIGGWHDADEAQFQTVLDQTRQICELARGQVAKLWSASRHWNR